MSAEEMMIWLDALSNDTGAMVHTTDDDGRCGFCVHVSMDDDSGCRDSTLEGALRKAVDEVAEQRMGEHGESRSGGPVADD